MSVTPITDAPAITFSNQKIRVMADLLAAAYLTAKSLENDWNAQSMSNLIPNTAAVIEDGASVNGVDGTGGDGRPVITGAQATSIITRAQGLINWMEGSADPAVGDGSKSVLNTILAVKVNGASRF